MSYTDFLMIPVFWRKYMLNKYVNDIENTKK